ncbi:MAG: Fluoride ion transporter CrcB, partial [uncultured Solirubrobacteraceae bacterium]
DHRAPGGGGRRGRRARPLRAVLPGQRRLGPVDHAGHQRRRILPARPAAGRRLGRPDRLQRRGRRLPGRIHHLLDLLGAGGHHRRQRTLADRGALRRRVAGAGTRRGDRRAGGRAPAAL